MCNWFLMLFLVELIVLHSIHLSIIEDVYYRRDFELSRDLRLMLL